MNSFEEASTFLSIIAILVSVAALLYSKKANDLAQKANAIAEEANRDEESRFRKANYFDYTQYFNDLPGINTASLIGPDIIKVANALEHIAVTWNARTVDPEIIYQTSWNFFKKYFEMFNGDGRIVPGYETSGLTLDGSLSDITRQAYIEMKNSKY